MEIKQINIEDTLIKQNDKVKELLIVFDGELELSLTSQEDTFLFEYLCEGSSYGQYSLLKSQDERAFVGTSSFQVKASSWSQVISIDHELLTTVRRKFRRLDRAIDKEAKVLLIQGVPYCDFYINHEALKR